MKIIFAEPIGFCFGVKRAIDIAEGTIKKTRAYSLGSIIHNPKVVKELSRKGLKVLKNPVKLSNKFPLVIRSHGIAPKLEKCLRMRKIKLVDATCPKVKKAQNIVNELVKEKYQVVIIGEAKHPEVVALKEMASPGGVVLDPAKKNFNLKKLGRRLGVVVQTTQSLDNVGEVLSRISQSGPFEIKFFNTICNDATHRQESVRKIAEAADVVLVIGGKMSANTNRLLDTAKKAGVRAYLIEDLRQIKSSWLKGAKVVGIASGASTPDESIKEVLKNLKRKKVTK